MLSDNDLQKLDDLMTRKFVEGYEQVVVPAVNEMKQDLVERIDGVKNELTQRIDELDDKLSSQIDELDTKVSGMYKRVWKITDKQDVRIDDHAKRLRKAEKKVAFC